jgi:GNAT superfamily N-acetyltransferase
MLSISRRHAFHIVAAMTNSRAASAATPGEFRVRALGPDDVLASASLIHADGIGWQQTEEDLKQVLNGQDALGVFLGDSLVSMATLPAIAPDFGWLAYVATAPDARRRGYARLLVSQLLSARGNRFACGLYGSEMGAPLYRSLGFTDRGEAKLVELRKGSRSRSRSTARPLAGAKLVPAAEALPQLLALDASIYGSDRSALLTRWSRGLPDVGWVLLDEEGHRAEGYVLGRPVFPSGGTWLGPLVARDERAAATLLEAAIEGCDGELVQALLPSAYDFDKRARQWRPPPPSDQAADGGEAWALARQFGFEALGDAPILLMVRSEDEEVLPPWGKRLLPDARRVRTARPFLATGFELG